MVERSGVRARALEVGVAIAWRRSGRFKHRLRCGGLVVRFGDRHEVTLVLVLVLGGVLRCANVAISAEVGRDEPKGSSMERAAGDAEFRQRLERLAAKCDEMQLGEQARITRGWCVTRDPRRQYFFLPPSAAPKLPNNAAMQVQQWHKKFLEYRAARADELFQLAKQAAGEQKGATAYQTLFEALRENPDHAEARRVLGFAKGSDGGWRMGMKDAKPRTATVDHPKLGWRKNQHWTVDTAHFHIVTNHNAKSAADLAQRLEELHTVWRQLFFSYWSSPQKLAARFDGGRESLGPEHRHEVVLFRNRQEYVAKLKPDQPQIEVTVGLYLDSQQTAFFFVGDETIQPTWFHEVTHQLFQEVLNVPAGVGLKANIWALEAVAMYMESLQRHDGYVTLGGVDADRLAFARYRMLRGDGVPLEMLVGLGRDELQKNPDIRRIYTHAAGLAHFLMDDGGGRYRGAFVNYLSAIYARRETPALLATLTGKSFAELDVEYRRFLNVTDDDLARVRLPSSARSLVLGLTQVTDKGLTALTGGERLEWIDLSFTKTTDAAVARFQLATGLKQLFLEKTEITDATLEKIRGFAKLEELDLSSTRITDAGLAHLAGLKNLKKLYLTNCAVSDAALIHLKNLKQLDDLEVTGTQVTPDGLAGLRRSLPKLK